MGLFGELSLALPLCINSAEAMIRESWMVKERIRT